MIQLSNDGVFKSTRVDTIPKIVHGFTTRQFGNMNDIHSRTGFMKSHGIDPDTTVSQEQIHGSTIHRVTPDEFGTVVKHSDGLVYKVSDIEVKHPILVVRVGDCIPLLFVDAKAHIIGVAHAGWKGTVQHIGKKMIRTFLKLGANIHDIFVIMGPGICQKCYEVSDDVAGQFQKEFLNHEKILYRENKKWKLDLTEANYQDCIDVGIDDTHIDFDKTLCTYEKKDLFYSWRRKSEQFGELMGYIGYTG
jgi:YfiH family protein